MNIKRDIEHYEKKKAIGMELAGKPSEESAQGKAKDIIKLFLYFFSPSLTIHITLHSLTHGNFFANS